MATIRWTEEAYNWLQDIFQYIARDNPDDTIDILGVFHGALDIGKYMP